MAGICRFGEGHAESFGAEQAEQGSFQAVVWACGVAERGADAAETFGVQVLDRRVGVRFEPVASGLQVNVLGECLGEPVGQRLEPCPTPPLMTYPPAPPVTGGALW